VRCQRNESHSPDRPVRASARRAHGPPWRDKPQSRNSQDSGKKPLTFDGIRRKIENLVTARAVIGRGSAMAKELPSLGELEIRVLRLVWQQQPCTERQITDVIQQEREVGRTTVLKTVQRLEAKGLLARVTGEGPVRFRATIDEEHGLPALIGRFVEGVLGG